MEFWRSRLMLVEIPKIRGVMSTAPDGGDLVIGRLIGLRHGTLSSGSFSAAPWIWKLADSGNNVSFIAVNDGTRRSVRLGVVRI